MHEVDLFVKNISALNGLLCLDKHIISTKIALKQKCFSIKYETSFQQNKRRKNIRRRLESRNYVLQMKSFK